MLLEKNCGTPLLGLAKYMYQLTGRETVSTNLQTLCGHDTWFNSSIQETIKEAKLHTFGGASEHGVSDMIHAVVIK